MRERVPMIKKKRKPEDHSGDWFSGANAAGHTIETLWR